MKLKRILQQEKNNLVYERAYTKIYKLFVLEAMESLINDSKLIPYLKGSRSGGFQHKLFQAYVKVIESHLPLKIKKAKNCVDINDILDPELNIFDGLSSFEGIVFDNELKNLTEEFYISATAKNAQPFFIGKLVSVTSDGVDIFNKVDSYSFSKIKFKNIKNGTLVKVQHLRVIPHYQSGAMSYINRIRKKISDQLK